MNTRERVRDRLRMIVWAIFHPRRSVERYEECLDCLIEAHQETKR